MIFTLSEQCLIKQENHLHAARPTPDTATAPVSPRRARSIAIIADDLTGACDAAVAFTATRSLVRVELSARLPPQRGVWAISTNTRDAEPGNCESVMSRVAAGLPSDSEVFKKIDSVFRGNTLTEIIAAARWFPADLVVLAPSYPELGRRLVNGVLQADNVPPALNGRPIAGELAALGCAAHPIAAGLSVGDIAAQMHAALTSGCNIVLCDAIEQPHLDAVVTAARSLNRSTLWIGSGGLAHALSAKFTPSANLPRPAFSTGTTLFFIGSDHPITAAQLDHLRSEAGIPTHSDNPPPDPDRILPIACGTNTEADIRRMIEGTRPEDVACLFLTGGDTARLVCSALHIMSLRLIREFAPGVPLGLAEGGPFDGVPVMLKSGGFGSHDLLARVLDAFSARKETLA